jgi:hypothetical protein
MEVFVTRLNEVMEALGFEGTLPPFLGAVALTLARGLGPAFGATFGAFFGAFFGAVFGAALAGAVF